MNTPISTSSIIFMCISVVLSVLLPIGAVVYLAAKKKLNLKAAFWGAVLFPVFALGLEGQLLHRFVLGAFPTLQSQPYLFALYGGLAAGLFEETARLVGFKWLIQVKADESADTGISYGLGHGGIESILVAGVVMVFNLIFSLRANGGMVPAGMESAVPQMAAYPPYLFLISGVERVFAMTIQIALSLIVMKAVMEKKYWFYVLAIVLHALVDFPAVLMQAGVIQDYLVLEGIVGVIAVIYAYIAYRLYRKQPAFPETA